MDFGGDTETGDFAIRRACGDGGLRFHAQRRRGAEKRGTHVVFCRNGMGVVESEEGS